MPVRESEQVGVECLLVDHLVHPWCFSIQIAVMYTVLRACSECQPTVSIHLSNGRKELDVPYNWCAIFPIRPHSVCDDFDLLHKSLQLIIIVDIDHKDLDIRIKLLLDCFELRTGPSSDSERERRALRVMREVESSKPTAVSYEMKHRENPVSL